MPDSGEGHSIARWGRRIVGTVLTAAAAGLVVASLIYAYTNPRAGHASIATGAAGVDLPSAPGLSSLVPTTTPGPDDTATPQPTNTPRPTSTPAAAPATDTPAPPTTTPTSTPTPALPSPTPSATASPTATAPGGDGAIQPPPPR